MEFFLFLCPGGLHVCDSDKIPSEPGRYSVLLSYKFRLILPSVFFFTLGDKNVKTIGNNVAIVAFPLQGIMWPQVITGILANLVNALLNYVFLFPLDMGIR